MSSETTSRLIALCFDANDLLRLARFWADALHWEIDDANVAEQLSRQAGEFGMIAGDPTVGGGRFVALSQRVHLFQRQETDAAGKRAFARGQQAVEPIGVADDEFLRGVG